VIMMMEKLVEWRLAGETEVLGENLPQRHFVHHKSHLTRPLCPNIVLRTLFSDTVIMASPLLWETKLYTYTKWQVKLVLYCIQYFNRRAFRYRTGSKNIPYWMKANHLRI
jgi:hypothetical protein